MAARKSIYMVMTAILEQKLPLFSTWRNTQTGVNREAGLYAFSARVTPNLY
jgi:hypothetical protein